MNEAGLEAAIEQVWKSIKDSGERIALKPTRLIVSTHMMRLLLWKPRIRLARGARGRKLALKQRTNSKYARLFRSKK